MNMMYFIVDRKAMEFSQKSKKSHIIAKLICDFNPNNSKSLQSTQLNKSTLR